MEDHAYSGEMLVGLIARLCAEARETMHSWLEIGHRATIQSTDSGNTVRKMLSYWVLLFAKGKIMRKT